MQINKIQSNLTTPILRSKSTKVNNNNVSFEAKAKVFMGAGSALAASALFSLSKESGINPSSCVNDFYQNELNSTRHKGKLERSLNRFTPEERYEIQQNLYEIKLFPNVFRTIADLKTNDTEYRFDAEDTMTLFLESAKEIEENPKVFEQIINIKDKEGNPRFSANDCVILLNNAKYISNNIATFIALAKGVDEAGSPMHDTNECISILRNMPEKVIEEDKKEAPKEPEKLGSLLSRVRKENNAPIILDTGEILPEEMTQKIRENRFCYSKMCRDLINLKNQNGTKRFTEKETCELLADVHKVLDNIQYVTIANKDGSPFFTNEQSKDILLNANEQTALVVFSVTMPDGSMRFAPEEYIDLLTTPKSSDINKNVDFFIAAANLLDTNGEPIYSAEECVEACKNPDDYPNVFKNLIKQKNEEYETKFKVSDFEDLGISYKSIFYNRYNREVSSRIFKLRDKYEIENENIKPLVDFIQKHKKEIDVVQRRTFERFLEANIDDKKFDIDNMERYLPQIRKFKISQEKMDLMVKLKDKNNLSTKDIAELIITD